MNFNTISGGIGVIIVLIIGWVIATYNKLVKSELLVEQSWADIDTQLKKRFDLIPNLVETVKGYATHEKDTLAGVVEARSKVGQMNIDIKNATPEQMMAFQSAQGQMGQMLGKIFALAENYPELKANTNFLELQKELTVVEDDLNMARRMYNGAVKAFNEVMRMFPTNIVANIFGFKEKVFFEATGEERENVKVQF